jgi:penicillin-binding protein 1B
MQLIKNVAFPKTFPQDVSRKFSETLAAYQLSLQCSPEEIVTYYLNKVGLNGGQGHSGIMAASLYTFGLPVNQLNPLEMMYLIATLKNGSEFKISSGNINYSEAVSHSQEIKTTLLEQAKSWYKQELVSKKEFNALKNQELRFVSSKFITPCQTTTKQFFSNQLSKADNKGCTYKTSISLANQQAIQTAVKDFDNEFSNFQKNGSYDLYSAALVIDIKTGEIIGHYGSKGISDLTTLSGGSNMGSLTKPFILCDLLEMGFSADNIQLYDGPIQGQATPQDYSRKYSYRMVGIDEALGKSLNAAFVNVRQLTEPIGLFNNVENHFSQMGIPADPYLQLNDPKHRQENILNYPLGSRNMTLFNIAQAYQTIFNNGLYIKLSALNSYYDPYNNVTVEIPKVSRQIYAANNANRIKVALHHTMMEGGTGNHLNKILVSKRMFYAKTGTTDGSKAGYTVLSDGETLIVTYVTYGEVGNDHLRLGLAPIPFGAGSRTAGVLGALIYNEFDK